MKLIKSIARHVFLSSLLVHSSLLFCGLWAAQQQGNKPNKKDERTNEDNSNWRKERKLIGELVKRLKVEWKRIDGMVDWAWKHITNNPAIKRLKIFYGGSNQQLISSIHFIQPKQQKQAFLLCVFIPLIDFINWWDGNQRRYYNSIRFN